VLERWDETCALFDAAAPLVEPWCEALASHTEDHGSAKWKDLERAELARARDDADVRAAIAATSSCTTTQSCRSSRRCRRSAAPSGMGGTQLITEKRR